MKKVLTTTFVLPKESPPALLDVLIEQHCKELKHALRRTLPQLVGKKVVIDVSVGTRAA